MAIFKENDVITLKTISGDEIVTKLIEVQSGQGYLVSKPHGVMMSKEGFGLVPWILTVGPEEKIFINLSAVASVNKTHDAVRKEYIKQTTGLVV
jgi:hypothetical protein